MNEIASTKTADITYASLGLGTASLWLMSFAPSLDKAAVAPLNQNKMWEQRYSGTACSQDDKLFLDEHSIITGFLKNLASDIEELPQDVAKMINEEFWDLF